MLVLNQAWLQSWLDRNIIAPDQVEAFLLQQGFELSPVSDLYTSEIVVGLVESVDKHPNADKLNVCQVDIGAAERLVIVCGCPSVQPGIKVAVATVGTCLGDFTIAKRKLRGIESNGMLCSMKELGFSVSNTGIWHLSEKAPIGMALDNWLQRSSVRYGIEITPNRGDCMSVQGMAREFAIGLQCAAQVPWSVGPVSYEELTQSSVISVDKDARAQVGAVHLVKLQRPSSTMLQATPDWMKIRLLEAGYALHHVVVDVLNYVMLETGQPMHAYSASKLSDDFSVAFSDECELKLLNGETVSLDARTLVVRNAGNPVCIAGYMGTEASSVQESDCEIYLESASFHSSQVAYHCRRYAWHTQSGSRFERGIDPATTVLAMQRAMDLLAEHAGFSPQYKMNCGGVVNDVEPIELPNDLTERLLGFSCDINEVSRLLQQVGCSTTPLENLLRVRRPTWRNDMQLPENLVSEFLRLHGMPNRPQSHLTAVFSDGISEFSDLDQATDALKRFMVGRGCLETYSYSFIETSEVMDFHDDEDSIVMLKNPISAAYNSMRVSLFPGLLKQAKKNFAKQIEDVRLFEIGHCFLQGSDGVVLEKNVLSVVLSGHVAPSSWLSGQSYTFYHAKSMLVNLFKSFSLAKSVDSLEWLPTTIPGLHPHQSGAFKDADQLIAACGLLHPNLAKTHKIHRDVFFISLDIDWLVANLSERKFRAVSNQSVTRRDLSLIVPDTVSYSKIKQKIQSIVFQYLVKIVIFDIYRGRQIPSGYHSVSVGLIFQGSDTTLTDDDLAPMLDQLLIELSDQLNIKTRGGNE